jgi:hypothetical protein
MDEKSLVKPVNQLLTKKMNRKHFLFTVGAGAVAATGISEITKNLINFTWFPISKNGYGSTSYGIKKETDR